ncbi:hypothetical protein CBL_20342 [Carabus blaptoides fortunei]
MFQRDITRRYRSNSIRAGDRCIETRRTTQPACSGASEAPTETRQICDWRSGPLTNEPRLQRTYSRKRFTSFLCCPFGVTAIPYPNAYHLVHPTTKRAKDTYTIANLKRYFKEVTTADELANPTTNHRYSSRRKRSKTTHSRRKRSKTTHSKTRHHNTDGGRTTRSTLRQCDESEAGMVAV